MSRSLSRSASNAPRRTAPGRCTSWSMVSSAPGARSRSSLDAVIGLGGGAGACAPWRGCSGAGAEVRAGGMSRLPSRSRSRSSRPASSEPPSVAATCASWSIRRAPTWVGGSGAISMPACVSPCHRRSASRLAAPAASRPRLSPGASSSGSLSSLCAKAARLAAGRSANRPSVGKGCAQDRAGAMHRRHPKSGPTTATRFALDVRSATVRAHVRGPQARR